MRKLLFTLFFASLLVACSDDDDFGGDNGLQAISFTVDTKYDNKSFNGASAQGVEVTLTDANTGDEYNATSNDAGLAAFEELLPGTYNVTGTVTHNAEEFENIFGYEPDQNSITFNGSQEQIQVNANNTSLSLVLKAARMGDLVIKQIYYAGSDTQQGALFRDQFIEIYNNSNEVIYADGLFIGQLFGNTSTTAESFTLPNGQFDWSQSLEMTAGSEVNTDYVYADYVVQIPGTGEQYPIQPGESMVLAQSALNHQEPLVDNNGDPISIGNPDLTVDLSGADFEVYLGDFRVSIGEEPYQWDIQNPAITDLNVAYWGREGYYNGNKDLIMDAKGRDSFVLFRTEDNSLNYANYPNPSITTIDANTSFYMQIPVDVLIDGVDLQHYSPSSPRPKMLPSEVDASSINCDGIYNSQSVIRKTKTTIEGRIILEDSNNSAQDFMILNKANPRGFAE